MRDLLRSLQGKPEVFRRRGFPGFERLSTWHAVEGVIDFHAIQTARIVLKKPLVGQAFGIEHRPPFFVAESRRAEPDPRHWGIMAYLLSENRMNIALDALAHRNSRKMGAF